MGVREGGGEDALLKLNEIVVGHPKLTTCIWVRESYPAKTLFCIPMVSLKTAIWLSE